MSRFEKSKAGIPLNERADVQNMAMRDRDLANSLGTLCIAAQAVEIHGSEQALRAYVSAHDNVENHLSSASARPQYPQG